MGEATTVSQEEEDSTRVVKQSEEKSSISTDSAISISSSTITGADSSATSSIDGDTDKGCPVSSGAVEAVGGNEEVSHSRAPMFRQPRYHYQHQHHRIQGYMRYEQQQQQQQQQVNLTAGAPFGTLYAPLPPPPPPDAPLAALHRTPLAYAAPTLFYEPTGAISASHHMAPQPPTNYCEAIGPTQPATAVYTAAAQANATAMPMALPGQPVNLNLLDQSLLMTQYGRPQPQPPEPHAIYYYTTPAHLNLAPAPASHQQQQLKSFTTNYSLRPPAGVEADVAPVPSSFEHHQQQQAMQLATSTCCCHQQQQQHEPAAPPLQAATRSRISSMIDEGGARQGSDADRDSRDAAASGEGKRSPATATRDEDLGDAHRSGQNLTQDLTSPSLEQQQPPSSAGCLGKSASPSAPHSPPSTTATSSPPSSSSSGSLHQPAASSRAVYMGHSQHQQQRDQQEAIRPYYRQPNGPTYYHHLLPSRPVSHHQHHQQQNQQYYNNTFLSQQQYTISAQQQQYLVAGRHYMPPHLYGQQPHPQHHQLHLTTNYPNTLQQQHRQLILLPSQTTLNYPHLNYQQLASGHHQQLYGHHLAATYAPHHHHHATPPMHTTAPYHHQHQAYACHLTTMRSQPPHLVPANYHQLPTSWPPPPAQQIPQYALQQQQHSTLAPNQLMPNATVELSQTLSSKYKPGVDTLLLFKQAQTWAAMLPIDYEPAKTRQAYGMDKVWRDEFEQLFSQLSSDVGWTLVEVETNPSLRNSACIVGYRGRYLIQLKLDDQNQVVVVKEQGDGSLCNETIDSVSDKSIDSANESTDSKDNLSYKAADKSSETEPDEPDVEAEGEGGEREQETESDCDSGAQVNSTRGCGSNSPLHSLVTATAPSAMNSPKSCADVGESEIQEQQLASSSSISLSPPLATVTTAKPFSTRFRMFIDSAKVRFCCDHCGHGWTSMKGRVVFWYELFELLPRLTSVTGEGEGRGREEAIDGHPVEVEEVDDDVSHLVGYCAYKLFGQQCDVCKIEGRFERPMWYPEEVTKVLNNLYNKIGQVYFGFKMPTIDKQRRAGKPKTSHNSSLCQACYDGVCTDRK